MKISLSIFTILTLIFVTLKLAHVGVVANWSWFWVLFPTILPLIIILLALLLVGIVITISVIIS